MRVTQRNEFGRASPGLLTQVRKLANLGHPYGVAKTSPTTAMEGLRPENDFRIARPTPASNCA